MSDTETNTFYSSKFRLVHIAANIALAPALLYLFGIWSLPPTLPHFATFAVTGFIAFRYAFQRWDIPRLVIDDAGLHFGEFIPAESIQKVDRLMRSLKIQVLEDGSMKEKVINLNWASNADFKIILELVGRRFPPKT